MVGGMGHSSMVALGVSLKSKNNVICLDGDGSLLMHMGALATIGAIGKKNFKYISRYAVCDDAVITADSIPKYDYQKKILGNRTWPFDLIIKCCVLVN